MVDLQPERAELEESTVRLRFPDFETSSSTSCSWRYEVAVPVPGGPTVGGGALLGDVSGITTFIGTDRRGVSADRWTEGRGQPPAARITLTRPLWPRS